ncbi:hypothetical protein DEM26_14560 [Thioclava sp. NG1]|nr:hypothetical protein DEM26_14560 [Thioclava sp. NG1]
MSDSQLHRADRVRKARSRLVKGDRFSPDDPKVKKFLSEYLHHLFDRAELNVAARPELENLYDVFRDFLGKHQLSFAEFSKWHVGPTSMMLGMFSSRFGSVAPLPDATHAFFSEFIEILSQPERTFLSIERGEKGLSDIEVLFLEGLPEGTALHERFRGSNDDDLERLSRLAALTGLTWQLALCEVTLMNPSGDKPKPDLAPHPTKGGGQRWSGGTAWVAELSKFARLHLTDPRVGARGPKSEASQIIALIEKGGGDAQSDHLTRRINDIRSGRAPLTFRMVEDICWKTEIAMRAVCDEGANDPVARPDSNGWQTQLFELRLHGHISGYMGYIERVWKYASVEMQRPDFLQDLHAAWQDWPRLYGHALEGHRERLAEFAL